MPKAQTIAEQNVAEVPLYTFWDVARYLRVPVWVPLALTEPRFLHPDEFIKHSWFRPNWNGEFEAENGIASEEFPPAKLNFLSLAVVFIHSPIFRFAPFGFGPPHWESKSALHLFGECCKALQWIASEPGRFPERFSDPNLLLSRVDLDREPRSFPNTDKLRKLILLHLERVQMKKGLPAQIYPFSRDPESNAPRLVEIDPEIRFGRPTVKGVPTDVLVERWRAGDTSPDLAEDYSLTPEEVDEALRYESVLHPEFPFSPIGW